MEFADYFISIKINVNVVQLIIFVKNFVKKEIAKIDVIYCVVIRMNFMIVRDFIYAQINAIYIKTLGKIHVIGFV
jgi:hypothetical protein